MTPVRSFSFMRRPSVRNLVGDTAAIVYLYDFVTGRGLLAYLSSFIGSVFAGPVYAVFGIFLSFVLAWNVYWAVQWLRKRRASPTAPQRIGQPTAEQPQREEWSLTQKQKQREIHYQHLLGVYRKWASYHVAYPSRYNYGSLYFRIHIEGLPNQENYYKEARTDLECYPKTHSLLLNAEKLVEETNTRGDLIVREMEEGMRQFLGKHDLKEWNDGGREAGKWYYYHAITLLVVKPIAEGIGYRRLKLVLQDRKIRAPEEGYDLAGNFDLVEAGDNSVLTPARLLQAENELVQVFYDLTTELVPKLSKKILSLQEDLKGAERAYATFKDSVQNDVIKRLETNFPIPNGGRCEICLSLGV